MSFSTKRALDFSLALLILMLCAPLLVVISLVVKATSSGPILFKQTRLTLNASEFTIYKFRTMCANFDKEAKGIQVKASSVAITPVGRVLRKTKLDELPQLFNILRGDMSFVGPRPELPRRLAYYSEVDKKVFDVLSGITSPSSIVFSNEEFLLERVSDPEAFYIQKILPLKISLNLYYVENRSFFYDFKIIITTLIKVFFGFIPSRIVADAELLNRKSRLIENVGDASN